MAHHGQQSHQHTHPISSYHQLLQNPSQKQQTRTSAHKRTNQQSEMPSERKKNNNMRNDNEHEHHRPVSHQQHYQHQHLHHPTDQHVRPQEAQTPASSPQRRTLDDSITQGSEGKQHKQTEHQPASHREVDTEPPRSKARINAVTVKLKNGKPVTTATCEDPMEAKIEERLLEPIVRDHQGLIQRS